VDSPDRRAIAAFVATLSGVIAVASGRRPLLVWALAVGAMAAVAAWWARRAARGVEVSASFRPARAFAGETVRLVVQVRNAKRLPVPTARVAVWLPSGLSPAAGHASTAIRGFARRVALPGRSEVVLEFPVDARRRGEYWLERVELELSDPFDLTPIRRTAVPEADLLVFPEPHGPVPVRVLRRLPFGMPAPAARMFEDRERFAGVRPYEPGDPLNRIHWKLTGHAGALQTKLFEPTRRAEVLLALDLAVGEPFWDAVYPEIAEDGIGWASYLARLALRSGWRAGLLANTHLSRGRGLLRVPPALAAGHEAVLFAALARMPNEPTCDLGPVLRETSRGFSRETSVLVISPRPGPSLRAEVGALRRRGIRVHETSPLERWLAEDRA